MSANKKRKSDVNIDSVGLAQPKKEKWFDSEQTKQLLAAPLPEAPSAGRRSSFIGALKRMVSGSALRDKNRSSSKLRSFSAVEQQSQPSSSSVTFRDNTLKENSDTSFASETSQESDIPVDKIAKNYDLLKFVRRSEAPEIQKSDSSFTGSMDSMNTSISSGSVFSLATPSRHLRRDEHRSSIRSMPESQLVDGLCLSAVRRNPSSVSDGGLPQSPLSKCSRKSFRMLRKLSSSMAELPENAELNTSFAPLAEMDEELQDTAVTPVAESMLNPKTESTKKVKRTGSRLFGRKRNSLSTPTEAHQVSFSMTGEDPVSPAGDLTRTTPSSSTIHRKVSSALSRIGLMTGINTPTGSSTIVKRTRTDKDKIRPDVSRRNSIATGFRTSDDEALEKSRQEADLFRKQVRLADLSIPEVVDSMPFDAIIVDSLMNGQPASMAAKELITEEDANALHRMVMLDPSKQHVIFKRDGKPTLICIKMDSPSTQPIDKRVRVGIGSGLREVFELEGVSRVLAYPMFCMNEEEWNDEDRCLDQLLAMTMHALAWNINPDKIEYVVLAGLTAEHSRLLKERYDEFVAHLPAAEEPKKDKEEEENVITETDL